MRAFVLVGFFVFLALVSNVLGQSEQDQAAASELYVLQTALPPYTGPQLPAQNLIPEVKFPVDQWIQFHGNEASNTNFASFNFRYSNLRNHNVNPSTCAAAVTMTPLPGNSGVTYDELFSFDLPFVFDRTISKATNVRLDLNIDSTITADPSQRGVVVALIDRATNFYVAFERSGINGDSRPLGRIMFGTTSVDGRTLLAPQFIEVANPLCRCNNASSSLCSTGTGYCPETEQSWNTYFSIEPTTAAHVSVSAFSQLWDRFTAVPVNTPGLRGSLKVGVFSTNAEAAHNLHGMWIQVRNEEYQVRTRIFSSIYTGTQLKKWADDYLQTVQNPITVPRTRAPYEIPYMPNFLSNDLNCYPDRWEFAVSTTTPNQGTPAQWNGGVRSSDEQEFEQLFYFPVVQSGTYSDEKDILITMHVAADRLNPSPDNRLSVGVTDASVSNSNAGRYFGFTRGSATVDRRLGWLVNAIQIRGSNGFLAYDPVLGDNLFQAPDDFLRVNLYLTRGGENTPTYIQVPFDNEDPSTVQNAYFTAGVTAPTWSWRLIQSRENVPPGHTYVFVEGWTQSSSAGRFLTQAFFSGGSTIDTSGRRLDGTQVLAINAFQFIGKTRPNAAETELVTLPGQNSGISMVAFSMDILALSCMRREGEPEQWDKCEVCNGNNECVDCRGVPFGTSKPDVCNVCNGNGTSCLDCTGEPFGTAVIDACGVCDGDNSTCSDCNGVPNGGAVVDACGVCGGGNASCADCLGVPNGDASVDACGVCQGDNTACADCLGIPNGNATIDACGVCNGDNSSCCINYLGVYNYIWDWLLLRVAIDDLIVKLENLYYMLECVNSNLPWYDKMKCDGHSNENEAQVAALQVGNMAATHTDWYLDCLQSFNEMVEQWTEHIEAASD